MRQLLWIALLFSSVSALALDNLGRIKRTETWSTDAHRLVRLTDRAAARYTSLIIEVDDESAIDDLIALGAVMPHRRENLVLAYLPEDSVDRLDDIHTISACLSSRKHNICLDKALPATNVPIALRGAINGTPYSGKNVVVGFSDMGFDHGHAAFAGRVKAIIHAVDSTATIHRIDESEIDNWTTDTPDEFHATHVAGILAGFDSSSPYQGVAQGAEIIAATSTLDDVGILIGVEEIIAAAKAKGKPAVINLSIGNTIGPHDGSDLFCRYLDLCAEDAAIVMSAGNDGGKTISVQKTLYADDNTVSTMLQSYLWSDIMRLNGFIDIWSSDARPLKARVRVWDRLANEIVWESEWFDPVVADTFIIDSADSTEFAKFFDGIVLAAGEQAKSNDRYNITFGVDARSTTYYPNAAWSQLNLIIEAQGSAAAHINIYGCTDLGFFGPPSAFKWISEPTSDQSVSSIACGFNTICVGSATTRDSTPLLSGGTQNWTSYSAGTVSSYTSYGTTTDGRQLPHFCAPGTYIVSAFNRYSLAKYPSMLEKMAAESPANPGHYYLAECGTSMASPHAAGIFALWLEADPTLSGAELRDIAVKTARDEGVDATDPRSGAGMIDAAAGLRYILGIQGIADTMDSTVTIGRNGNSLTVSGCDPAETVATVFTISGSKIYEGPPTSAIIPSAPLIVRLTGKDFTVTRKI